MTDLTVGSTNVTQMLKNKYATLKKKGWISLIRVPPNKHLEINTEVLKILINVMGYDCVYITLVKPCGELDNAYKKAGVDTNKLFFIDAISKMYGAIINDTKRYNYTSGPLDVDSITTSLRALLSNLGDVKKCVFLDTVTTVLLYNSLPRTLRFSQFLTQTLKDMEVTGVMVSIAKGSSTVKLVSELGKFCDEVVNVANEK